MVRSRPGRYDWHMRVAGGDTTGPAPARRATMSRWRQPRLLLGVALVLASAALGGWLFTSARDSTDYWIVREAVVAGSAVQAEQLAPVQGRVDAIAARALLAVEDGVPNGVWVRDVPAGSLVAADAVGAREEVGRQFPLAVASGAMPRDLAAGEVVDVWSGPGPESGSGLTAQRLLTAVPVLSVSRPDGTGGRTVVVDTGAAGPTAEVVAAAGAGHLTVVRVR